MENRQQLIGMDRLSFKAIIYYVEHNMNQRLFLYDIFFNCLLLVSSCCLFQVADKETEPSLLIMYYALMIIINNDVVDEPIRREPVQYQVLKEP